MAQLVDRDDIESLRIELTEIGRSLRSSLRRSFSSFRSHSVVSFGSSNNNNNHHNDDDDVVDEECALQWAAIERMPTNDRVRSSLLEVSDGNEAAGFGKRKRVIDVTKLGDLERHMFIEKLIKDIEHDNLHLLQKIRKRMDK